MMNSIAQSLQQLSAKILQKGYNSFFFRLPEPFRQLGLLSRRARARSGSVTSCSSAAKRCGSPQPLPAPFTRPRLPNCSALSSAIYYSIVSRSFCSLQVISCEEPGGVGLKRAGAGWRGSACGSPGSMRSKQKRRFPRPGLRSVSVLPGRRDRRPAARSCRRWRRYACAPCCAKRVRQDR
jgi:hypothetical protein